MGGIEVAAAKLLLPLVSDDAPKEAHTCVRLSYFEIAGSRCIDLLSAQARVIVGRTCFVPLLFFSEYLCMSCHV